jgi:osmoprotectant transport system permease protein
MGISFANYSSFDINLQIHGARNGNFTFRGLYHGRPEPEYDLVILADDQGFFPEYNGVFVARNGLFEDYAESAPNLREVLELLTGAVSSGRHGGHDLCRDVENKPPRTSRKILVEKGLIGLNRPDRDCP